MLFNYGFVLVANINRQIVRVSHLESLSCIIILDELVN